MDQPRPSAAHALSAAEPAQPVQQTGRQGQARSTRKGQFEAFVELLDAQAKSERKVWHPEDTAHLASLQGCLATQDQHPL